MRAWPQSVEGAMLFVAMFCFIYLASVSAHLSTSTDETFVELEIRTQSSLAKRILTLVSRDDWELHLLQDHLVPPLFTCGNI
uniref:Secreted protein n=1 Tax=Timema genevievae TaxID=629358 RepID=A0A7R9PP75_TIMGE|nr:unnamed protein product [Timema genevievae]